MALTDKTVTVVAAQAKVLVVQIQTNTRDGIPVMTVQGVAKDANGVQVGLTQAQGKLDPNDSNFQALMTMALTALQQANGLEDSDPVITDLDPAKALAASQAALARAKAAATAPAQAAPQPAAPVAPEATPAAPAPELEPKA